MLEEPKKNMVSVVSIFQELTMTENTIEHLLIMVAHVWVVFDGFISKIKLRAIYNIIINGH